MEFEFSVDLIGDLDLDKSDTFDLTGNATSLFCCITGNISKEPSITKEVLEHLSSQYRGVFFIDGHKEHVSLKEYDSKISDLTRDRKSVV